MKRLREIAANLPDRCGNCGSRRVAPLFVDWLDGFDCEDCGALWSRGD